MKSFWLAVPLVSLPRIVKLISDFFILLVIVAQKLKKRVDEIPLSKSIKDLVGRK